MNYLGLAGAFIWSVEMDDFKGLCGNGKYPLLSTIVTTLNERTPKPVSRKPVYTSVSSGYSSSRKNNLEKRIPTITRKVANRNDYKLVPEGADQRTAYKSSAPENKYIIEPKSDRYYGKKKAEQSIEEYSRKKYTPSVSRMENMNGPLKEPSAERHEFNQHIEGKIVKTHRGGYRKTYPSQEYDGYTKDRYVVKDGFDAQRTQYESEDNVRQGRYRQRGTYGDDYRGDVIRKNKYIPIKRTKASAYANDYTEDQTKDSIGVFKYRKEEIIPPNQNPYFKQRGAYMEDIETDVDDGRRYYEDETDEGESYYEERDYVREQRKHSLLSDAYGNSENARNDKVTTYREKMNFQDRGYSGTGSRKRQDIRDKDLYRQSGRSRDGNGNDRKKQQSSDCK